ncbi:MAG TPA: ABC transporter permease [Actinomycetota bacterium]|jgi:ABC-2 type transport system permease protein|nr:ABC transporter permease [Actinomycetota bacterium]
MWAMIVKEFRQLRRDRRTLAMMIFLPILMLVVFGYAARFDVQRISVDVVGPQAARVADALPAPFEVRTTDPAAGRAEAVAALRDGDVPVAIVTGSSGVTVLLDGSELFIARAARASLSTLAERTASGVSTSVQVLFNPRLETAAIMVPGLAAMILLFVGTVITSLGVVRERQAGTLEQLAVMPFRPSDVFLGKIAPYFAVAAVDMIVIVVAGIWLFDVPFRGSVLVLTLGALLFLFVTLGIGVLISSVSENQGQAIQLALMTLLPQVMLSGLIFPLSSMATGVRWIGYVLPLTYFIQIARGVMLRGASITALWAPFLYLAIIGVVVFGLATLRFRRSLAPAQSRRHRGAEPALEGVST